MFSSAFGLLRQVTMSTKMSPIYQNAFRHGFKFSSLAYNQGEPKVLDVLRLEQDSHGYFINFPGRTMPLPTEKTTIAEAQYSLLTEYSFGEMHFRDKEGIQYSASTPMDILIQDDFYIELENQNFFIVNTSKNSLMKLGTQSLITQPPGGLLELKLKNIANITGSSREQQNVISKFVTRFIEHLQKEPKDYIDKQHLNLILKNVLSEMSVSNMKAINALDGLIQIVENKLAADLEHKGEIEKNVVQKKLNKFFKRFFAVVLAQVGLIQYGTYSLVSWDFMEPITCLVSIGDAIVAFGYWLYVNDSYSYEKLQERKIQKIRKSKSYQKLLDESDLFARQDVLEYLYRQRLYLASTLPMFLKTFEQSEQLFEFMNSVAAKNNKKM